MASTPVSVWSSDGRITLYFGESTGLHAVALLSPDDALKLADQIAHRVQCMPRAIHADDLGAEAAGLLPPPRTAPVADDLPF